MPRYVVLCHDSPRGVHWDLMLEEAQVLRTWALPQPPAPGVDIVCEQLPDHRLAYLDFEGPVSGQRGTVTRWDRGTFAVDRDTADELTVQLRGQRVSGRLTLSRLADQPEKWRLRLIAE